MCGGGEPARWGRWRRDGHYGWRRERERWRKRDGLTYGSHYHVSRHTRQQNHWMVKFDRFLYLVDQRFLILRLNDQNLTETIVEWSKIDFFLINSSHMKDLFL